MRRPRYLLLLALLAAALVVVTGGLSACGGSEPAAQAPATVEPAADGGPSRITLTEEAAGRVGIQVVAVQTAGQGLSIPYSAIIYDADGNTWAFTNPEALVFVRAAVTVDQIQGDTATLSSGPPAGTSVVAVGAEELWGTELGVGHE